MSANCQKRTLAFWFGEGTMAGTTASPRHPRQRRAWSCRNDKTVCVGECRVVTMCLLQYCYNETVCDPCARTVVIKGN